MLADICGWFTEGLDIADLKDAKALVNELSEQSLIAMARGAHGYASLRFVLNDRSVAGSAKLDDAGWYESRVQLGYGRGRYGCSTAAFEFCASDAPLLHVPCSRPDRSRRMRDIPPAIPTLVAAFTIGKVIPVFIEVAGEEAHGETATLESVCASNNKGDCVGALDPEQAAEAAGGADKLVNSLVDENAAYVVGRSIVSVCGQTAEWLFSGMSSGVGSAGMGPGAGVLPAAVLAGGVAFGLARGAYLAANPQARLRDQLDALSFPSSEHPGRYHNRQKGFVYFPVGVYREIKVGTLWLEWPQPFQDRLKKRR